MLSVYDLKRILGRGAQPAADDIRIIDSWAEYKEDERCPVEERKLEYLCYEMEVMNPDTGERKKLYKALCFAKRGETIPLFDGYAGAAVKWCL